MTDSLPLVLGVDGGQSSTRCLIGRADGSVVGYGVAAGAGHVEAPGGVELLRDVLRAAVTAAAESAAPLPRAPDGRLRVAAAFLGLGAGVEQGSRLLAELVDAARVEADTDAVGALAAGTAGGPGAVVVAGTGVVGLAVGAAGERALVGGWGPAIDDAGGAYWLGREALRAAARAEDGRDEPTSLRAGVAAELGVPDVRGVKPLAAAGTVDEARIASLARLVAAAAAAGDPVARRLVRRAGAELADVGETTLRAGAAFLPEPTLVAAGGVLAAGSPVLAALGAELTARRPDVRLRCPELPPVAGAFLLAVRLAGRVVAPSVVERLRASLATAGADRAAREAQSSAAESASR